MPHANGVGATKRLFGLLGLVGLLVACGSAMDEAEEPITLTLAQTSPISVTGGQIQGVLAAADPGVIAFNGVPYAAPPVGDLRWRPPAAVVAWDGIKPAESPGATCIQAFGGGDSQSEDCLFLNVWAPTEIDEPLPVMVWIHGGGYSMGSGGGALQDGTHLAARDVVVVSLNYRLNAFGFLAHPALSAESAHDGSGNYGLMDMVAALEWVRDNIESFGGDASRVTIFGESAGAGAVMSLMVVPQSKGLFHRAIAQSNYISGWDRPLREADGAGPPAEAQGLRLAAALGAEGAEGDAALEKMRAASKAEVVAAFNAAAGGGYVWAPNVDGWVIPTDPLVMYQEGRQHDVPLITGMMGNEGSMMTQGSQVDSVEKFESYIRTTYPAIADDALAHYGVTPDTVKAAVDHVSHDMLFAGPVKTQATLHAKVSSPAWVYHFTLVPPTAIGANHGSHHAGELAYVFGTMVPNGTLPDGAPMKGMIGSTGTLRYSDFLEGDWTDHDHEISKTLMAYWTRFAATGNPNREGLPEWPEYVGIPGVPPTSREDMLSAQQADQHLTFGEAIEAGSGLHVGGTELFLASETSRRQTP